MNRLVVLIILVGLGYLAYTHYGYRYYLSQITKTVDEQMVMGSADGDITIVAYFDYSSDASKRTYTTLLNLISTDNNIRLIIRPVETESDISKLATRLALSAKRQDKFMQVNSFFLTGTIQRDEAYLQGVMRTLGLKYDRLKSAMNSDVVVDEATSYAREAKLLGIQSLPYFYIEHIKMPGNVIYTQSDLKSIINRLRKRRL